MSRALLALAAGLAAVSAQDDPKCIANFQNSTFNLQLFRAQVYYKVQDAAHNKWSRNYTYFFNVCGNIDPAMLPGSAATACNNTYPGYPLSQPVLTGPSPAFQVSNFQTQPQDACHRLGGQFDGTASTVNWGLYDPMNPSRGLFIQYLNGDNCMRYGYGRSLKVWIMCDTDSGNIPDEELVEETGSCAYEIFVKSAFGCPAECPKPQDPATGKYMLCSNHGICDFDAAAGNSRCFCNDGWMGRDCGTADTGASSGLSATGAVLVAVGCFLAITLGFLVYLWMRIRSLRLDPTAYSSLRAGPEDHADTSVQ